MLSVLEGKLLQLNQGKLNAFNISHFKPCYKLTGKKDKQTQARMSSAAMIISYRQGLTSSCSESGWAEPTSPGTWSDRDRYLPVPASPCFTPGDRLGQASLARSFSLRRYRNEQYRLNACRGHAPLSEPASAGAKTDKSYQRPRAAKQFFCRSFSHFPFLQPPEQAQKIIRKKTSTCFLSSLLATVVSLARRPGGSLVLVNRHGVMRHQVSLPGHLHGAKKKNNPRHMSTD